MAITNLAGSLETACHTLVARWGAGGWQWDDRFGAALAVFGGPEAAKMQALVAEALPQQWDSTSVQAAPSRVRDLTRALGGLQKNQLIFATDPNQEAFLYGTWWPWNDGKTISLRVFVGSNTADKAEGDRLGQALRLWFGLTPTK